MQRLPANAQVKLLFYIALISVGLYYIQERYNIFEISETVIEQSEKELSSAEVKVENSNGESFKVDVQVAKTVEERNKGLMGRENLEQNSGMLFIFEHDSLTGFWMKDTLIPLDMLFLNDKGEIIYIERDTQPCTDPPCPVYNPGKVYRYVLEVNGGWSKERRIEIGDRVVIPDFTSDS